MAELARMVADVSMRSRRTKRRMALLIAGQLTSGPERWARYLERAAYREQAERLGAGQRVAGGRASQERREGDRGGVLRACGRGLAALDEHRQTLGSSELRALATTHGRELATVALRHAATRTRARCCGGANDGGRQRWPSRR